ncbi:unnamed protein product [Sphagnum tenellum]
MRTREFRMPLDQMLEDAITHPAANNTTVLARDYFYTIRPPTSARFRARLNTVIYGDGDLVEVQRLNAADGLEVVTAVCAGIHGGYWYLRNLHLGLGDEFLAGDARYPTLAQLWKAQLYGGWQILKIDR